MLDYVLCYIKSKYFPLKSIDIFKNKVYNINDKFIEKSDCVFALLDTKIT